jgi:acyl-CoA synthetase (AMP-forming)/AMP-acid ligase II/peptidoglycan/LPS O-acetylase OafA/YrhL
MAYFFWDELERYTTNVAVVNEQGVSVTYVDLARMADAFADLLPSERQLVALQACNVVEATVAYLGCMRHLHPVILLGPEALEDGRVVDVYKPNFIYKVEGGTWQLEHLNSEPAPCSDELCVLLSTSGTTGAPKLVKLSHENINANARAIAEYLKLDPDARAITSLNFYYSYGMSVVNSHLSVGARIVLANASLVSADFWAQFQSNECTSLALVPYQFDFLDKVGFETMKLPSLKYITQAGGRLAADKIEEYACLSEKCGWKLFVMYGQTEAAPRISYIPPEDLLNNVDAIGRPVPGGEIVLLDDHGEEITAANKIGELVYRGPNVMLGYAEDRQHLMAPRDTTELRTGDLALQKTNGYFKIVGRLKRFIKLYGLRINLDDVETYLASEGHRVYCSGTDMLLVVFYVNNVDEAAITSALSTKYNIQKSHIAFRQLPSIPLLASGKINYRQLKEESEAAQAEEQPTQCSTKEAFRAILGERDVSPGDSFASVGGDSLSFLSMALFLEKKLGYLPKHWERLTVAQLDALEPIRSFFIKVPVEALLRVVAILCVMSNHFYVENILAFNGGSNALMLLAGYSAAKYQGERLKTSSAVDLATSMLGRILLVYYVVVFTYFAKFWHEASEFFPRWALLYANFYPLSTDLYPYWFISAYVQIILALILFWQLPIVRRTLGGSEHLFGYGLLAFSLMLCWVTKITAPSLMIFLTSTFSQLHLFALGWCIHHAGTLRTKNWLLISAIFAAVVFWSDPNFGHHYSRVFFIVGTTLALLWLERITMPKALGRLFVWLAAISFYLYIVHIVPGFLIKKFLYNGHYFQSNLIWGIAILVSILLAGLVARVMPEIERILMHSRQNRIIHRWGHNN